MVYLKEFQIPSDLWVAWYFTPWSGDISPLPEDMPEEIACLHPEKFSYHNTWYPWTIFENRFLPPDLVSLSGVLCPRLKFSDITIFYGGNGSGKSTLLNVIAEKLHSDRCVLHNTSPFFNDYVKACMAFFNTSILLEEDGVPRSQIITSDEVFKQLLATRDSNNSIYLARRDFRQEQYERRHTDMPRHIDPNDRKQVQQYRDLIEARRLSVNEYVSKRLDRTDIEKSNGEMGFQYFVNSIKDDSLILLDEPENSLSAMWQKELALFLLGAMREFRCQFIIATHSPFLLSIPNAKIYNLDAVPIQEAKWHELESMRCYYELFKSNEALFNKNQDL